MSSRKNMKEIIIAGRLIELLKNDNLNKINLKGDKFKVQFPSGSVVPKNIPGTDDVICTLEIDSTLNYFDFNKQNKITCIDQTKHEQEITDQGKWKKEKRQDLKPGKFIALFDFEVTKEGFCNKEKGEERKKVINKMIENFASLIASKNKDLHFEISDNIQEIYELPTQENGTGHLSSSCMRPESSHGCKHHAEAYDKIGNVQAIYKDSPNGLLYRALLWNGETDTGVQVKFLDRIYGNETIRTGLENHAIENNMAYRDIDGVIIYKEKAVSITVPVEQGFIDYIQEEGTPYFDTLRHCCNTENLISDSRKHNTSGFDLQTCEGSSQDNRRSCACCGDHVREDESYGTPNGDTNCEHCYHETYFHCDSCCDDLSRDDYGTDGMCETCLRDKGYINCDSCCEWSEDHIYVESESIDLCDGCAGDYCYCEDCEEHHHTDNMKEGKDEILRCPDCHADNKKQETK